MEGIDSPFKRGIPPSKKIGLLRVIIIVFLSLKSVTFILRSTRGCGYYSRSSILLPSPKVAGSSPPSKHASNVFRSLFLDKKANEANSSCSTSKRRTNFVNGRDREEAIHTPRLPAFERESKPQLAKVRSN